jgi:Protein of unknown function (DUF3102)
MEIKMNELTTERKIEFHKERAIAYLNMAAKNIILVGHELIAIKKELPHGQFGKWVEENLGVSRMQANNWMRLAENEDKCKIDFTFESLSTTAKTLFLSAPEEVKEQVKLKIDAGDTVSTREIIRLKEEHKQALQNTTKLYEEKLAAKPKEVVKEIIKDNPKTAEELKRFKDAHASLRITNKELNEEIRKIKHELDMAKIKNLGPQVSINDIKQTKIDTTRMENNLIAKERELREIEKQLQAIPIMVQIQVLLPKAPQEQLTKILAILEGK